MTINVILIELCIATSVIEGQRELPVGISPVMIPSTNGGCPSDDSRQASRSFLQNATHEIIRNTYINPASQVCGSGNWRRVFYLNASRSDQSCPGDWNLVTSPDRGCVGADYSCRSIFSDDIYIAYNKVCGRIVGEGVSSPDAFYRSMATIEDNYLDGVSITHGASGSRTHIWSFGAGHQGSCPCDNNIDPNIARPPPAGVGNNYFCDRADEIDRLIWTGESCSNNNPCCSLHNPPYFSVQLPAATTDRIELRICSDQHHSDETVLILFTEIYVQ